MVVRIVRVDKAILLRMTGPFTKVTTKVALIFLTAFDRPKCSNSECTIRALNVRIARVGVILFIGPARNYTALDVSAFLAVAAFKNTGGPGLIIVNNVLSILIIYKSSGNIVPPELIQFFGPESRSCRL